MGKFLCGIYFDPEFNGKMTSLDFYIVERKHKLLAFTLFLVKGYFLRFFQLNSLSETKITNGLKFKIRETATTTSPFYTWRHREHFNVLETT